MENLKDSLALRVPITSTIMVAVLSVAVLIALAVPVKGYPTSGTVNVPVILINFSDRSTTYGTADFEGLLFNSTSGSRSMWEYYNETSYGTFNITRGPEGVVGWYTASNNHDYYGSNRLRARDLAREAVVAADDAGFDFSKYDNDGDGYVDGVVVVHQGTGREASGDETDIHSHIDVLSASTNGTYTTDGVIVNKYTMQPEILAYDGGLSTIGVFGHEFGHLLGLPDLYDTNNSDGASEGIGWWGMMGAGTWNKISRKGDSPSHFSAWSKWFLGWITPTHVTAFLINESIDQVEFNDDVYQLLSNPGEPTDWTSGGAGSGEYFLVENRQNISFDEGLPGKGLLIWHIDESKGNNDNESHYLVALEQADGLFHLENSNNRGDAGDPWASNATGFTEATTPNTNLYNGSLSGVRVTDISASAAAMTADLIANWPTLVIFVAPTPQNNFNLSRNYVFVNATARESLSTALLEWGGTNETMNSASSVSWYKNKTGLADGSYTYRVWGNNSTGDWGASEIRVVTIDTTPPIITITSPSGATNDTAPELNFTVNELAHAIYSWDSEGNISGCRMCTSFNTTYGESVPDVNTSILLHFNENFDDTAFDDSTNSNDGTLGNATLATHPDWVSGRFGYALDFDAVDDFVKVADDDSIDFDNDSNYSFTMMFWVKTSDSAFSGTQYIFDKSSGSDTSYNGYHMFISNTDSYKLRFMYHQAATVDVLDVSSTGPIYDGEWHHIVAVRNITEGKGYLYIDGVLNSSTDDNSTDPEDNSGDLYIGARGPAWNNFNGTIDDFHIIARALDSTEIGDIYNKTLPEGSHTVTVYANDTAGNLNSTTSSFTVGAAPLEITIDSPANDTIIDTTPDLNFTVSELANTTYNWNGEGNISGCGNCTSFNTTYGENNGSDANLTVLWHMNENYGTTAYDDASNNDGMLGNATAGTKPAWTTGKFGHALEFDGTSDFVNVSDSQDLDLNGSFTLTAWIYSTNSTDNQAIIFKIDKFPAWHGYHFNLMKGANSMKLRCMSHNKTGGSDSGDIISNDSLSINEWHFVACVRDISTGNLSLYVDGAEAAAPATDNSTNKDITNDVPLFIGTNGWGAAYFNGTIDEVAIYDRALSAAEIQGLYSKALLIGQRSVTVYAVDNASNSNSETRWFTVSSIDITSPLNTTIYDTTPDLNFTVSETANTTYNWDGEGNISGCRNCTSFNTTYGENNGSDSDLVGLWHLNENFGTMVYGDSPYGNDGDVINTPAWSADCRFGACLDFQSNGQDQVNISGSSLDSIAQEITVSLWFYLDSDDYPGENFAFLKKGNEAGTPMSWGAWYKGASDDLIRVRIDNSTSKVVLDTAAPTNAKEWYHLAFTYNGSAVRIYLNGELNVSTPHSGNIADTAGYPLAIGKWGGAYYDGKLDETMIFNRSLDASEIHDLYGRTLPAGQHSVTVWATDSEGDQDSATRYFTIE